jgi:16S rRNA (cytosine1402-N4)-methyltransferase
MAQDREYHRPVMAEEVVDLMVPVPAGVVVDATFGGGGHAERLRSALGPGHRLLGIDRDPEAVAQATRMGEEVKVVRGNFARLEDILEQEGITSLAGALFDFGVSAHQLDEPSRGFSYQSPGPLDMRMDPSQTATAADLVNDLPRADLAELIRTLGEEPGAARIAAAIVRNRPIRDTAHLARVVAEASPGSARRLHPARRTFQALRIAVNDELGAIRAGLDAALGMLVADGRCVAISYHSLEDRIVKQRFAASVGGCTCPPEFPVCACGANPRFRLLTRGVLRPQPDEVAANRRARSARLRAIQKVAA